MHVFLRSKLCGFINKPAIVRKNNKQKTMALGIRKSEEKNTEDLNMVPIIKRTQVNKKEKKSRHFYARLY